MTGQRLLKITDIPNGLVATVTAQHDTEIVVTFAADGHRSVWRAADPESSGVLTGTPVPFGYIDKETELAARQPLISLSPRGRIAGIRYNDSSMLPLRLPAAEAEGDRHLQGCYADLDGLLSTPAALRRRQ